MNKRLLPLFAFLLMGASVLPAQNLLINMLADSSLYAYYNQSDGSYSFGGRAYYYYNTDNLLANEFGRSGGATGPSSYYRYDYQYNTQNLATLVTSYNSSDTTMPWNNLIRDHYEYDAQGRTIYLLGEFGNDPGWINYYQEFYWFDDAAKRDSTEYQLWDDAGAQWGHYRRTFTQYLADGKIAASQEDEWKNNAWSNLTDHDYVYLPDGKLFRHQEHSFDVNGVESFRIDSFIYNAQGQADTMFYRYINPSFNVKSKVVFKHTYDANGNLILKEGKLLNAATQTWTPSSKEIFEPGDGYYSDDYALDESHIYQASTQTYRFNWRESNLFTPSDPFHVLYYNKYEQLTGQGVIGLSSERYVWYRIPTVGASQPSAAKVANCQFANPLPDGSYVICNAPDQSSPIQVTLNDAFGRQVQNMQVMPGEPFTPNPGISNGMYFITVTQDGVYLGAKKIVLTQDR